MKLMLVGLVCLLILQVGCANNVQISEVEFNTFTNDGIAMFARGWDAEALGVYLSVKPRGLNEDVVFLMGALKVPGASIRSVLLRSGDGGETWAEVMTTVTGSDIMDLFFLDKNTGWTLVMETVEGPGNLWIYGTDDGGKTWEWLSKVPKRHYSGQPVDMGFIDEKIGRLEMLYDGASPADGFVILATSDGGRSWSEVRSVPLEEYKASLRDEDDYKEYENISTSKNGSQWKLERRENNLLALLWREDEGDEWELKSLIPYEFRFKDGIVKKPFLPVVEDK
ncbi:hypothetical protein GF312_10920 [Candidatus Poribacteria bacterium]|nr:hypothetical protein [Candidatus Poribacteria bacterium]